MTLADFLDKWSKDNRLAILIHSAFQCDIRTFTRWKAKSPRHLQITLTAIDRLWEATGEDYSIFLEL